MAKIKIENLDINEIQNSSGVLSGKNTPVNWKNINKSTDGFGKIEGNKNKIFKNLSVIKKR